MTQRNSQDPDGDIENEIHELRNQIETRNDFAKLLDLLHKDYIANSEEWENTSLEMYLEAMAAWLKDSEKYYAHRGELTNLDQPSWRVLADALLAARVYE